MYIVPDSVSTFYGVYPFHAVLLHTAVAPGSLLLLDRAYAPPHPEFIVEGSTSHEAITTPPLPPPSNSSGLYPPSPASSHVRRLMSSGRHSEVLPSSQQRRRQMGIEESLEKGQQSYNSRR